MQRNPELPIEDTPIRRRGERGALVSSEPEGNSVVAKRPILVCVANEIATRDQTRFDTVVLENETFQINTKFLDCVRISDSQAREHPLLRSRMRQSRTSGSVGGPVG